MLVLVAGVVALVAFAVTRTETPVPDLYPRGAPPKGVLRVVGVTPSSVSLAWDPVHTFVVQRQETPNAA